MNGTQHTQVHREHHQWHADHAAWSDELAHWTDQHHRLNALLRQAIELMRTRARSLELHQIAIDCMEQKMKVVDNAAHLGAKLDAELMQKHHATHREHVRQGQIHQRLKASQQSISAHLEELMRELEPICVMAGNAKVR